jgi:hypothetical protein
MRENIISAGIEVVVVGEISMLKAQRRLVGCQSCSPSVSRPFSSTLVEELGAADKITEYVLCRPCRCPNCAQPVLEHTLVRCEGDIVDAVRADLDFGRCWDDQ